MGLTGKTLVMITAYQYGLVNKESLRRFLDEWVFPRAKYLLLMYAVRNNYIKTVLHNSIIMQEAVKYPDFMEYLKELDESLSEHDPELEKLFLDVVKAEKSNDLSFKILVADKLVHYQHCTGNFLDEDIVQEYAFAERIIEKLLV